MAETYIAKEGDMIDQICWRFYDKGQQPLAVERVYNANPGLAVIGPKLPAGTLVTLPELPRPEATPIIAVWG